MVPLAHARWSADRRAVVTPEAGDQHRVVDRRGDRRGRAAHLSARRVDGRRRVDVEVRADPARHARGRNGEGVGSWVRRGRPGDLPVRRDRDILSVVGGVDDQRPARGGRDRRRARAGVRGDRRHHDVVGERARGPADGERRGAAGTAAAGARRAAEPDARRSRAGFRRITLVDRRAAHGPRVPRRVRARRARAAAHVGGARIAVVGARGPVRLEGVGRTRGARPGAVLGYGARARRGAADRARRQEAVGGTGGARPGALLRGIAHVDGGPTDRARRQECVGRTGCAGAGAALGHVARTGCGAAHGARVPRRVLAGHVGTIALIQGAGVGVGRAGSAGRLLGVRRTGGGDPVAGLRQVALARRRAADRARGLDGVGRAGDAGAGAGLGHVTGAYRCAADGPGDQEGVGRTGDARAGALLGDVARARRGAADRARRQEAVGGTGGARAGALLRGIAHVDGGPTDRARRQECVGRTGGARAGAALGHVARTGCGAARGARVPRRVLAGHVGTIALIQGAGVGVGRAGSAGRLLGVRRTGGGDPVAGLCQVALARRRAADRARGLDGVSRAGDAGGGAGLGHVTGTYRCAADGPGDREGVGRTGDGRAGALVGDVARARRGAADRARRQEAVGGTGGARPGALLRGIAHVDGGPTDRARRQECVGRAGGARAGTVLGQVADARRGAADGAGGQEEVGRTGRARAGAGLGHVARPGCRAAHGARVPRRVLAGGARAVAHVEGAGVGVGRAGGAGRLHGVGLAGWVGAVTCLGRVTGAYRCAADGPLVPRRVRAGVAATVAHVQGAGVGVGRAGGAGCLLTALVRARRAGAGAVHGHIALTERCAAEPGARPKAAGGRATGACYSVRRPQIAVLARVHDAVAAIRIRRVGGDVRYPIPGRAQRAGGVVGVGGGYDLVLRVEGEGASPIRAHPREACVGAALAVVAGREDVTFETVGADGADEKLDGLGGGGGGTGVRRGASTVAGTGLVARARLGEARELVSGE